MQKEEVKVTDVKEAPKAVKAAAKTAAKTAETKVKETAEKAAEKATAKKEAVAEKTAAKKEAVAKKATAAKSTAKTAAKKTVAKAAAKTATVKAKTIIQYQNCEADAATVEEKVKAQFVSEGHKASSIKSISIYVKPEEYSAYYVINEKFSGRVDLF